MSWKLDTANQCCIINPGVLKGPGMAKVEKAAKKEMKKLFFGEGLMDASLDGSKTFTIRKYRAEAHDLKKGELVIGTFKDGLDIILQITTKVIKDKFKNLKRSKDEADKEGGHWFDEKYFEGLKSYYPDLTWESDGAVIFFEVMKVNGIPVVQYGTES